MGTGCRDAGGGREDRGSTCLRGDRRGPAHAWDMLRGAVPCRNRREGQMLV